jgi:hypothetical protein
MKPPKVADIFARKCRQYDLLPIELNIGESDIQRHARMECLFELRKAGCGLHELATMRMFENYGVLGLFDTLRGS